MSNARIESQGYRHARTRRPHGAKYSVVFGENALVPDELSLRRGPW